MSWDNEQLRVGEFVRWMNHIDKRFDALHTSLIDERERINDHAQAIAALEASNKTDNRRSTIAGSVSGSIGGFIGGLISGAWGAWGGKS